MTATPRLNCGSPVTSSRSVVTCTYLFGAAVRLGQLAAAGGMTEDEIIELLRAASRSHVGVDRFSTAEADRAIANGLRYGRQHPRQFHSPPTGSGPRADRAQRWT